MKQWVQLSLGIVGVVALLAALTARESAAPPPNAPNANQASQTPPADPETKLKEVIERTGGDYSRLTADEKAHLDAVARGHGRDYFELRARQQKQAVKAPAHSVGAPTSEVGAKL